MPGKIAVKGWGELQVLTSEELTDDRPTLVAIHGADGDRTHWVRQHEGLGGEMNFVAVDLPGHGGSDGSPHDSIEAYRDVVADLIETLGLGPVFLMGHSMGGAVCLLAALSRPELLRGIVLVGSGARLKVMPAILQGLRTNYEQAVRMSAPLLFSPRAPRETVERFLEERLAAGTPEAAVADFTACNGFDVMGEIDRIALPVLVVSSDADRMTPVKYGRFLADKIPGARFTLIEGSGHLIPLEKGGELNRHVSRFVEEIAAGLRTREKIT